MSSTTAEDPGCKFPPGVMRPKINLNRCEAKGPCVPICPYDVLAIHTVPPEDRETMSLVGKLKLFVHGGKQAYAVDPDACRGCGLCVRPVPSTRSSWNASETSDRPAKVPPRLL